MATTKGRAAVAKEAKKLKLLRIEYVAIDSLTPNDWNPNRQSDHEGDLLRRSMEDDGFTQPIIALRDTQVIVDGYHRWKMARSLGYEEIPVAFVDMTAEQARVSTLRHNRARGSEDLQLTAQLLKDLEQLGVREWAQESLMMDTTEMDRMLQDIEAPEALAGDAFGDGWTPQRGDSVSLEDDTVSSQGRDVHVSRAAGEKLEKLEKDLAAAKTEEERATARREARVHRFILVYGEEEGKLVRAVLGNRAQDKVLEMCRAEAACNE